jgi:hypothetical protein
VAASFVDLRFGLGAAWAGGTFGGHVEMVGRMRMLDLGMSKAVLALYHSLKQDTFGEVLCWPMLNEAGTARRLRG